MKTITKKIEVFRLTISGLEPGTNYNDVFLSILQKKKPKDLVKRSYSKSHSIMNYSFKSGMLFTRYISYKRGHHPDIIDLNEFTVSPNPLGPSETGVEWTHTLSGYHDDKYYVLLEYNYYGITSSTLTSYLIDLISEYKKDEVSHNSAFRQRYPYVLSLEAVPGLEFINRLHALKRIRTAKLRTVQPNPGWRDLESELGEASEESNAHKTDVSMSAPRGKSLNKQKGIVGWIIEKFHNRSLDFAELSGETESRVDTFNTKKLGKSAFLRFAVDDNEQIIPNDMKKVLEENFKHMVE